MDLRLDKSNLSTSGCLTKNNTRGGTRGAFVTCRKKKKEEEEEEEKKKTKKKKRKTKIGFGDKQERKTIKQQLVLSGAVWCCSCGTTVSWEQKSTV